MNSVRVWDSVAPVKSNIGNKPTEYKAVTPKRSRSPGRQKSEAKTVTPTLVKELSLKSHVRVAASLKDLSGSPYQIGPEPVGNG